MGLLDRIRERLAPPKATAAPEPASSQVTNGAYGARLGADRDALRDKAAFGAPIGTEWRREERANRTAAPLDRKDAEGISGRDWMDRAKEAVSTYQEFSRPNNWRPSNRTLESFREDARYAVADAWRHPEAAKAMQTAGASERGMQDDLSAGKAAKVMEGLSASGAKSASESAPDPRAYARDHWQKIAAAGADAAKIAQSARQSETEGKRAAPRM